MAAEKRLQKRRFLVACAMNIKVSYLYRDAGNYKNFGEVVFTNSAGMPLNEINALIRQRLIDGQWFVADKWNLPDLHFKEFPWNSELDHDWHELEMVEQTEEGSTDGRDISAFIEEIKEVSNA